jgi:hypothetical protein
MFRKTLVATLIVASAAFALVNKASAAPQQKPSHEISWLERASTNYDGGGY